MLSIRAAPQRLCDGIARRDFLRLGAFGGLGLSLPGLIQARGTAAPQGTFGRAKRCLLLFLTGGPSQLDTFDLKPDAPEGIRGELKPVATSVPGIRIGELCPKLAQQAHRYCIVRSVTHGDKAHTSAGYTMLTGMVHAKAGKEGEGMAAPGPDDHPHLGALVARARNEQRGPPAFVSMPEVIKDANINEFPGQDAGFLGKSFGPMRIEMNAEKSGFRPPELVLPADLTGPRLADRRSLRMLLDDARRLPTASMLAEVDSHYRQAFDLLNTPAVQRAFQLDREPDRIRSAYGGHLFGQGCLLARRLLEAGVSLVTVYWHYEGPEDSPVWDTHWNNFKHLRERLLPPADQALSTVLEDLAARGLLEETLVVIMGEFGRTPKVNKEAGRDHWPHVQSILLAGPCIRAGSTYGASDRSAAYPADNPVSPQDLMATFLHLLGVPPGAEFHDRTGRPLLACHGTPVAGLLA
jgi:hypothetical protein